MKPSPKNSPPPELEPLRTAIDSVDRELLTLLNQRLGYAKQIGQLKARQGARVLGAGGEAPVLRQILAHNRGPISDSALRPIFGEIMSVSGEIQ
ncbi:MAG: chorismate mutase, partial [Desulfobacterales bacterium]